MSSLLKRLLGSNAVEASNNARQLEATEDTVPEEQETASSNDAAEASNNDHQLEATEDTVPEDQETANNSDAAEASNNDHQLDATEDTVPEDQETANNSDAPEASNNDHHVGPVEVKPEALFNAPIEVEESSRPVVSKKKIEISNTAIVYFYGNPNMDDLAF
ncbi:MAG: hypothetical protein Q9224_005190, partial [Gallowayella concinna]